MPKKILLVEDDRKMLDVMQRYLENRGFIVIFTDNGSEALMLARDSKPDLIGPEPTFVYFGAKRN